MSRVSTKQRHDGYIQLEKDIGTDAHFRSFLEGICYAEKIIASEKQDQPEPVAWMFFSSKGRPHYHLNEYQALEGLKMYGGSKVIALYEHPAPRKQDDEPVATLDHNGNFKLLRMVGVTVGQPINLYALEEKNK